MKCEMKVLLWFPQIGAAAVQGTSGQYLVSYEKRTCSCPDHRHRRRMCKHLRFVLEELGIGEPGI